MIATGCLTAEIDDGTRSTLLMLQIIGWLTIDASIKGKLNFKGKSGWKVFKNWVKKA